MKTDTRDIEIAAITNLIDAAPKFVANLCQALGGENAIEYAATGALAREGDQLNALALAIEGGHFTGQRIADQVLAASLRLSMTSEVLADLTLAKHRLEREREVAEAMAPGNRVQHVAVGEAE